MGQPSANGRARPVAHGAINDDEGVTPGASGRTGTTDRHHALGPTSPFWPRITREPRPGASRRSGRATIAIVFQDFKRKRAVQIVERVQWLISRTIGTPARHFSAISFPFRFPFPFPISRWHGAARRLGLGVGKPPQAKEKHPPLQLFAGHGVHFPETGSHATAHATMVQSFLERTIKSVTSPRQVITFRPLRAPAR